MTKRIVDRSFKWPQTGAMARRAKHVGYRWGSLYKNTDGSYMLLRSDGRKFLVRDIETEIVQWDDRSATQPLGEGE